MKQATTKNVGSALQNCIVMKTAYFINLKTFNWHWNCVDINVNPSFTFTSFFKDF